MPSAMGRLMLASQAIDRYLVSTGLSRQAVGKQFNELRKRLTIPVLEVAG